jgi:hypothetical protein
MWCLCNGAPSTCLGSFRCRFFFISDQYLQFVASKVWGQAGSFTTNGLLLFVAFVQSHSHVVTVGGLGAAQFSNPTGIAWNSAGMMFISEFGNARIVGFARGSLTATFVIGQGGSFTR